MHIQLLFDNILLKNNGYNYVLHIIIIICRILLHIFVICKIFITNYNNIIYNNIGKHIHTH